MIIGDDSGLEPLVSEQCRLCVMLLRYVKNNSDVFWLKLKGPNYDLKFKAYV